MAGGDHVKEVAISEFKAQCSALLEQVRVTHKPIRVTRFGRPVAEIGPPASIHRRVDWIGSMKNSIEIVRDIISPASGESEWEAIRKGAI
jgi:prevent-host-death family protein